MTKKQTPSRLPTLQISCTEEFKRDVEQLAMAFGYADTKSMLFELVEHFLNLPTNQAQLKKYRGLLGKKPALPFGVTDKPQAKASRKKVDKAAQVVDAVKAGVDNAETT